MHNFRVSLFQCFIILCLSALHADYLGGEYRTLDSFMYGRFEAVFRPAAGDGLVSSFFTYNDETPNTPWCEIDIEVLGRYPNLSQFNVITDGQINHLRHHLLPFNPQLDFHTYAFEWTPEYVAWFIDGTEMHRQEGEHVAWLTEPQKIMMNIWNPVFDNWVGDWNESVLPRFAFYDQVSYAAYTPEGGNTGTNLQFTAVWTDHFDDWDQSRWEKAEHTFPGNQCTFSPDNVVFQDGYMILCLTNDNATGYTDNTPPQVIWARAGSNQVTIRFSEELNSESAEDLSAYIISGLNILDAVLQPDQRTVVLAVSEPVPDQSYSLVVLGIDDLFGNSQLGQVQSIIMPQPLVFQDHHIKINVGGSQYQDFWTDQEWLPETEYGYLDGTVYQDWDEPDIQNSEMDEIFWTQRNGLVQYCFRLPEADYQVFFHFSEASWQESQNRQFDVYANSNQIISDLDIYNLAGSDSALEIPVFHCQPVNEILTLTFSADTDAPILAAIDISDAPAGCSDPAALNYSPDAVFDDGTCECSISGDVNGDGAVDILDIVLMVDLILFSQPSPCQEITADQNQDGTMDVTDILLMVETLLGITWAE